MEITGLPLHPLVVHAVVVLGPLAALAGLAFAFVPRWRWLLRWPLVGLALVTAAAGVLAASSGQALVEARPELGQLVEDHAGWGEGLRNAALAYLAVVALGAWSLGGPSALASGRGARDTRAGVGVLASVLIAAGAVAVLVLAVLAGDSGSRAVWG